MSDRELRKLSRAGLLEILVALSEENDRLQLRIQELEEQIAARELQAREAGSLASVAAEVSGVLLAAQKAADLYLHNLQNVKELGDHTTVVHEASRPRREAQQTADVPAKPHQPAMPNGASSVAPSTLAASEHAIRSTHFAVDTSPHEPSRNRPRHMAETDAP